MSVKVKVPATARCHWTINVPLLQVPPTVKESGLPAVTAALDGCWVIVSTGGTVPGGDVAPLPGAVPAAAPLSAGAAPPPGAGASSLPPQAASTATHTPRTTERIQTVRSAAASALWKRPASRRPAIERMERIERSGCTGRQTNLFIAIPFHRGSDRMRMAWEPMEGHRWRESRPHAMADRDMTPAARRASPERRPSMRACASTAHGAAAR